MLQNTFVEAFNRLFGDRDRLIEDYAEIIEVLTDTAALDKEFAVQESERDVVTELMRKDIEENAHNALDQEDFKVRREVLLARYIGAKSRMNTITKEIQARAAKRESIMRFMDDLANRDGLLTEFDEALWCETVETVTVYTEKDVAVAFKDGSVVHIDVSGKIATFICRRCGCLTGELLRDKVARKLGGLRYTCGLFVLCRYFYWFHAAFLCKIICHLAQKVRNEQTNHSGD